MNCICVAANGCIAMEIAELAEEVVLLQQIERRAMTMANEVRLIGCRKCDAYDCEGCNIYTLSEMLRCGEFDCMMDDHHTVVLTPETLRPKGRWMKAHNLKPYCSECGKYRLFSWSDCVRCNYCPNCGADMRGDVDERP